MKNAWSASVAISGALVNFKPAQTHWLSIAGIRIDVSQWVSFSVPHWTPLQPVIAPVSAVPSLSKWGQMIAWSWSDPAVVAKIPAASAGNVTNAEVMLVPSASKS